MTSRSFLKKSFPSVIGAVVIAMATYFVANGHEKNAKASTAHSKVVGLYAFQSPVNPDNMVFVINTDSLMTPAASASARFDSTVLAQVKIDITNDAIEDLVLQVTFEKGEFQIYGPGVPSFAGTTSALLAGSPSIEGAVTKYGADANIISRNGMTAFAGPRDDPFFFDDNQYNAILDGTAAGFSSIGNDSYKNTNVMSVVIEVPKAMLGTSERIFVWATSSRKK